MNLDQNLQTAADSTVVCRHCGATVGESLQEPMGRAIYNTRPAPAAGPGIKADPALFTDRIIMLRQAFCPGCLVCLSTEVGPIDEPAYRTWELQ